MKPSPLIIAVLAIGSALSAAPALANDAQLRDCVDLSAEHSVRRAGDSAVAIRDGDRYRAQMRDACTDLGYSNQLAISTEQQPARLCPQGSKLTTQRDQCSISRVEAIDAQAFKRYTKR